MIARFNQLEVSGITGNVVADYQTASIGINNVKIPTVYDVKTAVDSYAFLRPDFLWKSTSEIYSKRNNQLNPIQLRTVIIGDSYATWPENLARGPFGNVGKGFNVVQATIVSGATLVNTDFAAWINGTYTQIPSGGAATYLDGFNFGSTIKVYFITSPSGGTFKIQTSTQNGAFSDEVGFTSVSTFGPSGGGSGITINKSDTNIYQIKIIGISGVSKIVGGALMGNSGNVQGTQMAGVSTLDLSLGGTQPSDWVQCPSGILNNILGDYKPNLIFLKSDDPGSAYQTYWPTIYNKLSNAATGADFVVLGSHPTPGETDRLSNPGGYDDYFREWCFNNTGLFVDCRHLFPNNNNQSVNLGFWDSGNVHLKNPVGTNYLDYIVWQHLRPLWAPLTDDYSPAYSTSSLYQSCLRSNLYGTIAQQFQILNPISYNNETNLFLGYLGGAQVGTINYGRARGFSLIRENTSFNPRGLAITNTDGSSSWIWDDNGRCWAKAAQAPPFSVGRSTNALLELNATSVGSVALDVAGLANQTSNIFELRSGANTAFGGQGLLMGGADASGYLFTTTNPLTTGHVVNKKYVDNNFISGSGNATPPINTVTPVVWINTIVSGVSYKIPLYQ